MNNKKILLISIVLNIVLTITFFSLGIFFPGVEILILPLLIIQFLIGISVIITIPSSIYIFYKTKSIKKHLIIFIGLSIGFFIGFLIQKPIDNWDKNQRNLSGKILSSEIEKYLEKNKNYPENLHKLNINSSLPINYKTNQFQYKAENNNYKLEIQIPISDKWIWNNSKQEFIYSDF